ncbi:MAG TPA: SAM-dependent methyltransferase, partial [Thermomicrobiales bacterium]|nr:SAM-dependent methyltransferase [Thermomicrobiales bacterium]
EGLHAVAQIEAGLTTVPDGIYDLAPGAATWFGEAIARLERGYAIVIDYGYPAPELYSGHRLGGTLRAYRDHAVSDDPFADPGNTDLTAHVDFSALRRSGEEQGAVLAGLTTQGAFLSSLNLGQRLLEMQTSGDTTMQEYLAAQAVVLRLIDPGGLGRFRILLMARNAPIEPPLLGLAVSPPPF